jgi:hypothetical protein
MEERGVSKLVGMKLTDPRVSENGANRPAAEAKPTQSRLSLEGAERARSFAATR